ncbi:MAG TPA: hypothetical protein PLD23_02375 [Armatimonadota bacterium]|nr:hypothetical protein [Armatimonadota bacterium]HQK92320.1 hypothetical protein [Armatimonadota bacterium]
MREKTAVDVVCEHPPRGAEGERARHPVRLPVRPGAGFSGGIAKQSRRIGTVSGSGVREFTTAEGLDDSLLIVQ